MPYLIYILAVVIHWTLAGIVCITCSLLLPSLQTYMYTIHSPHGALNCRHSCVYHSFVCQSLWSHWPVMYALPTMHAPSLLVSSPSATNHGQWCCVRGSDVKGVASYRHCIYIRWQTYDVEYVDW